MKKRIGTLCLIVLAFYSYSQTSTLNPTIDAFVDNQSPTINFGGSSYSYLEVGVKILAKTTTVRRSLIQFDLNSIPQNAVITSASLIFTKVSEGTDATNSSYSLQRLDPATTQWVETSVNWNNQPASITSDAVNASTSNSTERIFDVKDHVSKMVSGIYANRGWIVKRSNETVATLGSTYKSRHATPQPRLVVVYYLPFTITSATVTHASSSVALNGGVSATVANGPSSPTYQWYNGQTGLPISGATSSTLSNVGSGWYGLKITGTQGAPVFMAFIVGVKCQPFTINFNPGPDYIDDATLKDIRPGINFGTNAQYTSSYIYDITNWAIQRSALKFKLWLSSDLTITQGDLLLYGNSHVYANRSNESKLSKIIQGWDEAVVCWNNAPSITTTNQITVPATSDATSDRTLSILNFLNDWKNNNASNNGVMLDLSSTLQPAASMNFHSSESTTTNKWPQLNLQMNLSNLPGCQPGSIDELSYSELKSDLDGGYGRTFQGRFKILLKEEEAISSGKYMPFVIYDENNNNVASMNINGATIGNVTVNTNYTSNSNYLVINVSNVSGLTLGTYFTIEVTTSNGTKKYLKVLYYN